MRGSPLNGCGLTRSGWRVGALAGVANESAPAQLMLALYRSGRQAEALEAYHATRRVLVEGLGIEPSPAVQELEQAILRQDAELNLARLPPPRRASAPAFAPPHPAKAVRVRRLARGAAA